MTPESAALESHLDSEPATSVGSRSLLVVGVSFFAAAVLVFLGALSTGMVYDASAPAYARLNALFLSIGASLFYWPLLLASIIVCGNAIGRATRKRLAISTMTISFVCLLPATLCLAVTVLWLLPMFMHSR